jgi:hypothetical protein
MKTGHDVPRVTRETFLAETDVSRTRYATVLLGRPTTERPIHVFRVIRACECEMC